MLRRTLRGTEWAQLLDYVSPSFFDVLPARAIWKQLREIGGNVGNGDRVQAARQSVEAALAEIGHPVRVGGEAPAGLRALDQLDEAQRSARGQRALEIYFSQIAGDAPTLVDLRAATFAGGGDDLHWNPRPLLVEWDPAFQSALRDLYGGFYRDDDPRFRAALAELGIGAAEDVFREHFGADDQRAVRFKAAAFQATFHEVFVRCRDAGVSLHHNFLALGIYLGCLYDHLEALHLPFDVRQAYLNCVPLEKNR